MAFKTIADKAITVRIDGTTKEQAERMLNEIGINMTSYVASSLKALVRERKIPFEMVTSEYLTDRNILSKLAEVDNDPNNKWLSRDEVFGPIRERFGYEV
jgi:addiction module RelB/DinJ family antitoxin